MPEAQVGNGLAFKPTEEELEAARAIIKASDQRQMKNEMAAMTGWLKKHKEVEGHADALASRCEERRDYLIRYMV